MLDELERAGLLLLRSTAGASGTATTTSSRGSSATSSRARGPGRRHASPAGGGVVPRPAGGRRHRPRDRGRRRGRRERADHRALVRVPPARADRDGRRLARRARRRGGAGRGEPVPDEGVDRGRIRAALDEVAAMDRGGASGAGADRRVLESGVASLQEIHEYMGGDVDRAVEAGQRSVERGATPWRPVGCPVLGIAPVLERPCGRRRGRARAPRPTRRATRATTWRSSTPRAASRRSGPRDGESRRPASSPRRTALARRARPERALGDRARARRPRARARAARAHREARPRSIAASRSPSAGSRPSRSPTRASRRPTRAAAGRRPGAPRPPRARLAGSSSGAPTPGSCPRCSRGPSAGCICGSRPALAAPARRGRRADRPRADGPAAAAERGSRSARSATRSSSR